MKRFILLVFIGMITLSSVLFAQERKGNENRESWKNNTGMFSRYHDNKWSDFGLYAGLKPENELIKYRTKDSKTFENGDGTNSLMLVGDLHYKDDVENWNDIDVTINNESQYSDYQYSNLTNKFKTFYSEHAHGGIKVEYEKQTFEFAKNFQFSFIDNLGNTIEKARTSNVAFKKDYRTLFFQDFYNGIDYEITQLGRGIESGFWIKNSQTTAQIPGGMIKVSQQINLPNGCYIEADGAKQSTNFAAGEFIIKLPNGDNGITFEQVILYDGAWDYDEIMKMAEIPVAKSDMPAPKDKSIPENPLDKHKLTLQYNVIFENGLIFVEFLIPAEWLDAPDRIFPVFVDPEFTIGYAGSNNSTASWAFYNTYYHDQRWDFQLTNAELNGAGITNGSRISGIGLLCYQAPGQTISNARIRLSNDTWPGIGSWLTTGWQVCYGPVTLPTPTVSSTAWNNYALSCFTYSSANGGLCVNLSRDNTAFTSGGGNYTIGDAVARGYYRDSGDTWPYDGATTNVSTNISRPAIRIVYEAPVTETYGNNQWNGYVYNAPSNCTFGTYSGSVTEAAQFTRNVGEGAWTGVTSNFPCGAPSNQFAVRYRMTYNFTAGTYLFTINSDDRVRFSVDGGSTWLIAGNWGTTNCCTAYNASVYLSGSKNLVLEFYEDGGGASVSINWVTQMAVPPTGSNSYTTCSGTIYDAGGSNGYYNLATTGVSIPNGYTTIYPSTTGAFVQITGGTYSLEPSCGYDKIIIYDGVGTSGAILWQRPSTGCSASGTFPVISSSSGPLTIQFNTQDATANDYDGFAINISCFLPGDNCSNAQNLATLTPPFNGTTNGYTNDINNCRTGHPDRVFYIDVPNQTCVDIWQVSNDYDSYHSLAYGGSCPGATQIYCIDDPDTQNNPWINTTGSTQRLYYVQDAYSGSGTFTLNWVTSSAVIPIPQISGLNQNLYKSNCGTSNAPIQVTNLPANTTVKLYNESSFSSYYTNEFTSAQSSYSQITQTMVDGMLRIQNTGTDPFINISPGSFSGNTYRYIAIRYKVASGTTGNPNFEIYIGTTTDAISGEDDKLSFNVADGFVPDGNWHVAVIDMWQHPHWKNATINALRLDFGGYPSGPASGSLDIYLDYFKVISPGTACLTTTNSTFNTCSAVTQQTGYLVEYFNTTCGSTAGKMIYIKPQATPTPTFTTTNNGEITCANPSVNITATGALVGAANYTFTRTTGTYSDISGTTAYSGSIDDNYWSIPLPFTFNFAGQNFSTIYATSNGEMNFNSTYDYYTNMASSTFNLLAVHWDDMGLNGNIQYVTTGTSPNRVFTIQVTGMYRLSYSSYLANYQVKLYETTNVIEYIYGTGFTGYTSVSGVWIGLTSYNGSTSFLSVTPTNGGATSSNTVAHDVTLAEVNYLTSGTIYRFTPNAYFVAPLQYSWSGGSPTNAQTTTLTNANTYTLTITDANGCSSSQSVSSIIDKRIPAPTVNSPTAICYGSSVNLNAVSPQGATINWYATSNGGTAIGSSNSGNNYNVAPTTTTTYYAEAGISSTYSLGTPSLTANNNYGGVSFDMQSLSSNNLIITGIDALLNSTGSTTVELYYRTSSAYNNYSSSTGWILIGTQTVNANASSLTNIVFNTPVTIPAGQTYGFYFVCSGGWKYNNGTTWGSTLAYDSYLSIKEGYGISTYSGFTSSVNSVRNFCGKIYYSYGSSFISCTRTPVTVTVNTIPTVSISSAPNISVVTCTNPTITLTANASNGSGAYNYTWSGAGSGNGSTFNVTSAGNYQVSVISSGCSSTLASVTITQNTTPPTASITTPSATTINCTTPNITLSATGGGNYNWSGGTPNGANTVITAANILGANATFTVTVTNPANGCSAEATSVLINKDVAVPIIAFSAPITNFCAGSSTSLSATGASSYLWNTTETTNVISISQPGTYSVTATGANGCTSASNQTFTMITPSTTSLSSGDYVWSGQTSTDWNLPSNWLLYGGGTSFATTAAVPNNTKNVIIRDLGTCNTNTAHVTLSGTAYAKNITIETSLNLDNNAILNINGNLVSNIAGSSLSMLSGSKINITGNWTNINTFGMSPTSEVVFNGSTTQIINNGNTNAFTKVTFNNPNGFSLDSQLKITDMATFTNGIIEQNSYLTTFSGNNAQSQNANNQSFIKGKIKKTGSSATPFICPVGDVRLRTIGSSGNPFTKTFKVYGGLIFKPQSAVSYDTDIEYFYDETSNILQTWQGNQYFESAEIHHVSSAEYWKIKNTGTSNFDYKVEYILDSYDDDCIDNGLAACTHGICESDYASAFDIDLSQLLVVYKNANNKWESLGGTASGDHTHFTLLSVLAESYTYSGSKSTNVEEVVFSIGSKNADVPLPVELLNFIVDCKDGKPELFWQTATETNNEYFVIERASENGEFIEISQISGQGTTNTKHSYSFLDKEPLSGTSYYRLTQIDYDGHKRSFKIIVSSCKVEISDKLSMIVYPNPFTNEINIKFDQVIEEDIVIELFDNQNKLISKYKVFANENIITLKIPEVTPGTYNVKTTTKTKIFVNQIVKGY